MTTVERYLKKGNRYLGTLSKIYIYRTVPTYRAVGTEIRTSDILRLGGILTGVSSSGSASAGRGTSRRPFELGADTLVTIVPVK